MKNYKDGQNGVDKRGNQSQYGLDEISDKKEKMKKPEALDGNLNRERKIQEDLEQKINLDLNSAFHPIDLPFWKVTKKLILPQS